MTIKIEVKIWCDGGPGCPVENPIQTEEFGNVKVGDLRYELGKKGWINYQGNDYCPACVVRVVIPMKKEAKEKAIERKKLIWLLKKDRKSTAIISQEVGLSTSRVDQIILQIAVRSVKEKFPKATLGTAPSSDKLIGVWSEKDSSGILLGEGLGISRAWFSAATSGHVETSENVFSEGIEQEAQ